MGPHDYSPYLAAQEVEVFTNYLTLCALNVDMAQIQITDAFQNSL